MIPLNPFNLLTDLLTYSPFVFLKQRTISAEVPMERVLTLIPSVHFVNKVYVLNSPVLFVSYHFYYKITLEIF